MKNKHEYSPINSTVELLRTCKKRYSNELLGSILYSNTSTAANVEKHTGAREDTSEETMWRIGVAGWVRKVTRAHTQTDKYVLLLFCGNTYSRMCLFHLLRTLPVFFMITASSFKAPVE